MSTPMSERMFPIQSERGAAPHPLQIPWPIAELAYSVYSGRYGRSQSLERLAERGGFGPSEMDEFVPDWRERCDHIQALARERDELRAVVEKLPVTADGKPALPGATVYCPSGHPVALALVQKMVTCQHDECYDDTIGDKHQIRYEVTRCYSSPEAALAKPPTS